MEVLCPKYKSYSLEFDTVATDVCGGVLTMVEETYCCSCEYQFTTVSHYKLDHFKNEIIEND